MNFPVFAICIALLVAIANAFFSCVVKLFACPAAFIAVDTAALPSICNANSSLPDAAASPAPTRFFAVSTDKPVSVAIAFAAKSCPAAIAKPARSTLPVVINCVIKAFEKEDTSEGTIFPICVATADAPALNTADFRASVGSAPDATLVAKFITPVPIAVAAAPAAPKKDPIACAAPGNAIRTAGKNAIAISDAFGAAPPSHA